MVTVEQYDSLETIREIFDNVRFHHLLVVEKGKLLGVISDRDLLKALSPFLGTLSEHPRDLALLKRRAHQIMSRKPITTTREASLEEAVRLLLRENVSCLPVVSSDGRIEGIVTWKDLVKACLQELDAVLDDNAKREGESNDKRG